MDVIRIRLPEAFDEQGLTAYEVAKRSRGRLQASTLYRLVRQRGQVRFIDAELLDILCDILSTRPGELLERAETAATHEPARARRIPARRRARREG
jgi:DNA-binding Xre family transcriptional regulator